MTVPTQTALEVPQTGLGAALGQGLQKGTEMGLQGLLKKYTAQKSMTEFQKLSTDLRQKEQKRKTENAIAQEFLKLGDPFMKGSGITSVDVLPLSRSAVKIMEDENVEPIVAMDEAVNRFQTQRNALGLTEKIKPTVNIPQYKAGKSEAQRNEVVSSLKENQISNPNLIGRALVAKKWPSKEIKEILNNLKKTATKKLTPEMANKFLKAAGNNKEEARKLAKKAGYSF